MQMRNENLKLNFERREIHFLTVCHRHCRFPPRENRKMPTYLCISIVCANAASCDVSITSRSLLATLVHGISGEIHRVNIWSYMEK